MSITDHLGRSVLENLISKMEAAVRLQISIATLDRLRRRPDFPRPLRITRRRLAFDESEIDAWLAAQREERSAP